MTFGKNNIIVPNLVSDLYSCLVEEEEQFAVQSFLQDLRGQELLDSGTKKGLSLDDRERLKRFRNPIVTMEARHQQVCVCSDKSAQKYNKYSGTFFTFPQICLKLECI